MFLDSSLRRPWCGGAFLGWVENSLVEFLLVSGPPDPDTVFDPRANRAIGRNMIGSENP
jgi:hypothetical protein